MLTLKKINNAIKDKFPGVILVKGEGYFYVDSDLDDIGLKIAALQQQSIYVYKVNDLPLKRWIECIDYVLKDSYRIDLEREPVFK
jgi:hypothetical protein